MTKPYNVEDITAVTFYKGSFFQGYRYIDIREKENKYFVTTLLPTAPKAPFDPKANTLEITKAAWHTITRALIEHFRIAEWNKIYDSDILDGEQWALSVRLKSGRHTYSCGNNAYPKSFDEFSFFLDKYYRLSESHGISVDVLSVFHLFR